MDGLTSHRNDCLSDKFNRRFLEMMWSHTHILARLPVYHLKCWQIATINPKRKRTLTSEVATVVRDGESIQMKLQLTLEQHRFELRGSANFFCSGPDSKYIQPRGPRGVWGIHSALLLSTRASEQCRQEGAWPRSNRTVFTEGSRGPGWRSWLPWPLV